MYPTFSSSGSDGRGKWPEGQQLTHFRSTPIPSRTQGVATLPAPFPQSSTILASRAQCTAPMILPM
ncbi:MAG: hypothetical protein A4E37_00905 [Methanoregulaceae archaeon PtaB.Bin056]|nr:MAG: hypothetical protein A4E37_00905 [Methanoregulaceae archaeon PtaB.Bin056]